jgi:hypothetical protein
MSRIYFAFLIKSADASVDASAHALVEQLEDKIVALAPKMEGADTPRQQELKEELRELNLALKHAREVSQALPAAAGTVQLILAKIRHCEEEIASIAPTSPIHQEKVLEKRELIDTLKGEALPAIMSDLYEQIEKAKREDSPELPDLEKVARLAAAPSQLLRTTTSEMKTTQAQLTQLLDRLKTEREPEQIKKLESRACLLRKILQADRDSRGNVNFPECVEGELVNGQVQKQASPPRGFVSMLVESLRSTSSSPPPKTAKASQSRQPSPTPSSGSDLSAPTLRLIDAASRSNEALRSGGATTENFTVALEDLEAAQTAVLNDMNAATNKFLKKLTADELRLQRVADEMKLSAAAFKPKAKKP